MYSETDRLVLMIFTAVSSLGVLLQAFILLGIFLAVKKAAARLTEVTDEAKGNLLPILVTSRSLLDEVSPKIKVITNNLVETTNKLREQAIHVNATVDDIVDKSRVQAARVDEMVAGTLDTIEHATEAIQHSISAPIRQISGVLNGLRAGFEVLKRRQQAERETADSDLFV